MTLEVAEHTLASNGACGNGDSGSSGGDSDGERLWCSLVPSSANAQRSMVASLGRYFAVKEDEWQVYYNGLVPSVSSSLHLHPSSSPPPSTSHFTSRLTLLNPRFGETSARCESGLNRWAIPSLKPSQRRRTKMGDQRQRTTNGYTWPWWYPRRRRARRRGATEPTSSPPCPCTRLCSGCVTSRATVLNLFSMFFF